MSDQQLTVDEFAAKIKAKYPDYASVDNAELVNRIVTKYPEYKSQINFGQPKPQQDTGVMASLKRTGSNLIHLPGQVYDAFTKPPQNDQETMAQFMPVGGQSLPPSIALGMHRLIVAPMISEAEKAKQLREQAKTQTPEQANNIFSGTEHMANMHQLPSMFPVLGPVAADITQRYLSGDKSGAITDLVTNVAGPKVAEGTVSGTLKTVGKVAPAVAERMYQSALKPSTTLSATQRANLVKTGLDAGIPISPAGAEKITGLINDLNDKIAQQIKSGAPQPLNLAPGIKGLLPPAPEEIGIPASNSNMVGTVEAPHSPGSVIHRPSNLASSFRTMDSGATIDPRNVVKRLDAVKARFANQVNADADLQAIDAAKAEFLKNNPDAIPVGNAQSMKQGTYQQLKGRAYGELKSATVEAQKALARGLKEELETQFPEIKGLNAQEAKFIGLDQALERALNRIGNHQLVGIGTPIVAGAVGGSAGGGAGIAAGLMKALIDDPIVKSKLAIALNKAGRGKIPIGNASARVTQFSNLLAQSQKSEQQ